MSSKDQQENRGGELEDKETKIGVSSNILTEATCDEQLHTMGLCVLLVESWTHMKCARRDSWRLIT